MPSNDLTKQFIRIWDAGRGDKGTLENHLQECYNLFYPPRSDIIFKDTLGSKRHEQVFVNVGEENVKIWANGLLNGIFPTTSVFHELILPGTPKSGLPDDALEWLEYVARLQFNAFVNSNAYQANYDCYIDEGVAGTSCCYIGESINRNRLLHFKPFSIENFEIAEDAEGVVDTCIVQSEFSPKQMVEVFGDRVPRSIRGAAQRNDTKQTHKVFLGVMPNPDYNPNRVTARGLLPENQRPFIGSYYMSDSEILGTVGYYEFPFIITRINKAYNERYGRSPASSALHSLKMLTQQAEYDIIAVERASRPAYLADSHSILAPINPHAGTITPFDSSRLSGGRPIFPFPNAERPDLGFAMEEKLRRDIEAIFMKDVFITLNSEDVAKTGLTATQIQVFKSERLSQLGPLLKVNEREKIRPIMNRIFGILLRSNRIPEPPDSIKGAEFEVSPTSPIYSAVAGASEIQAMQRIQQYCFTMTEVSPEVWDNVDVDGGFRTVATTGGTVSAFTRDEDQVRIIREQRAQAQQQQQELQLALLQQQQQQQQQPVQP